ncbi:proteinaceous RNase P 1, chloroplastic/mitochondrial-like isoform X1 [Iris pallida]|uniref:ribonuclease P n=1 Tax=Iris pallida TaxID=29817 RepID=A0AAX6DZH7_IRIPA|nr:proteinaceous RNase P 1, chloroplastic/mitochondrial-like isoform X1 [Iris pallida]
MASCSFPSPISFKPHSSSTTSHARKLLRRAPPQRLQHAHSKKPPKPSRNQPTHPPNPTTHAEPPRSSEATISNKHELRLRLDMCSKSGDVLSALSLYDSARERGLQLDQYHYNVLLYLCSSASLGVVHRAKSGSRRNPRDSSRTAVHVTDDVSAYARARGFEIYETMLSEGVPTGEAALTSVARMAMSAGDGDAAFGAVRRMEELGVPRRLRSYAPAILAFCGAGDVDRAFDVERHMTGSGIPPEEPELEALLRASVRLRRGDRVYCLLHKLRTNVRQVSPSVAEVIEEWFRSPTASRVGKRKWDVEAVERAMESGGGGWHGLGWLGRGKWAVARANVDDNGVCGGCGDKLVTIDLDPVETENFARSVADIASKRERSSSFQKFQRWLDYYGPFEAVVDAANVGLFCQRQFSLTKVNAVVNAIRQKIPSRKWPLIILHNRRLTGRKMVEPLNEKVIEKWKNADAIYATPTGSNDDWYWLYAAIKCKCLLVTNDEMRDHLFQILGNDFFPKWKERHQVHFSFQDGSFTFHMPPPCSIVIQESEKGHWHIPISEDCESSRERTWLCVTRANSLSEKQHSSVGHNKEHPEKMSDNGASGTCASSQSRFSPEDSCGLECRSSDGQEDDTISSSSRRRRGANSKFPKSPGILSKIEAAEKLSGCIIDFQI